MPLARQKYPKPGCCPTKWCRNKLPLRSNGHGGLFYTTRCNKCISRERRERDPVKYVFERLKRRSGKLDVPFGFTVDCLRCFFSIHREYLELKGSSSSSLHLDRRVNELGYTPQNLRPLVASKNIAKGNRERHGQPDINPDWDV